MQLEGRKAKILEAIIATYLETGEPVGSRTISRFTDLKLSSATIRNEMADLEELGYIEQPHTSAGRIPTDLGYRLYVDTIMEKNQSLPTVSYRQNREEDDLTGLEQNRDKLEAFFEKVARMLARDTNYATIVSTPVLHSSLIKYLHLSLLDSRQLLVVVVLEQNITKHKVIQLSEPVSSEEMVKINLLVNHCLQGIRLANINMALIKEMRVQAGRAEAIVSAVLEVLMDIMKEEEEVKIYTSGANNIFRYPELSSQSRASEIIFTLEEKQQLMKLVNHILQEDTGAPRVYIGSETSLAAMEDCAVVTAVYDLGNDLHGTVGIIGPKRMDYDYVLRTLNQLVGKIDYLFRK
ncbi:MAG: heat-inducible transcriptional repressor HrcA [Lachnospiraceae bacterium]|nr:heat-inducible transcriptional repressor HrcA [Lachnospiraceae bacterium]MDY5742857.1 heat-inducible transcriptional repressor HrcA [Lachnospiraceae bacterium]